jgi:hypothetical protein
MILRNRQASERTLGYGCYHKKRLEILVKVSTNQIIQRTPYRNTVHDWRNAYIHWARFADLVSLVELRTLKISGEFQSDKKVLSGA